MRVLRSRIGQMPSAPELAMAYALQARRLRHVSRCNCGKGRSKPGCSTEHPRANAVTRLLGERAVDARQRVNEYRANRSWKYHGGSPREGGASGEANDLPR